MVEYLAVKLASSQVELKVDMMDDLRAAL